MNSVYEGFFEKYISFYVFEEARLIFYHGSKKRGADLFQNIDLVIQHYMDVQILQNL